jgi:glycosyltransferase involved in cell wall biosynthesis
MISTFAPTRCGIARFSEELADSLERQGRSVDIFRLVETGEEACPDRRVAMEFDPSSRFSVQIAAEAMARYPVAILQHEFGIYGPDEGRAVEMLVEQSETPVVVVLHTIPLRPTAAQASILARLVESAAAVVVPSHSARAALSANRIDTEAVLVMPHGSSWAPADMRQGRRGNLMTWGLLGPGKGVERAIDAVSRLRMDPPPFYRIVGQTHPNVLRLYGHAYRDSLVRLASALGIEGRVSFDEGYKTDADLYRLVVGSDLVVIPYDNDEQISSGVLSDALAAGRPVVATDFPHARELLAGGAGVVVGHDPGEMAEAIERLLTDDIAYRRAVVAARQQARRLSWSEIGRRYDELLDRLAAALAVV